MPERMSRQLLCCAFLPFDSAQGHPFDFSQGKPPAQPKVTSSRDSARNRRLLSPRRILSPPLISSGGHYVVYAPRRISGERASGAQSPASLPFQPTHGAYHTFGALCPGPIQS